MHGARGIPYFIHLQIAWVQESISVWNQQCAIPNDLYVDFQVHSYGRRGLLTKLLWGFKLFFVYA